MAQGGMNFQILIDMAVRGANNIRNAANQMGGLKKQALALVLPLAGIGTAMIAVADDMQEASARIKSGAEVTASQLEKLNKVAKRVWESGAADSIAAGADEVIKAFQKAGDVSEEQLFRIARNNANLAKRFKQDTDKSTSAAAAMVKNLGITWDQAYDILAKGMKSGVNVAADDLLESFSEYSTQFKDIGFDAAEMYSIMISGANEGVMGTDKVVDSLKEMKVKLSEMPPDVQEALEALGISSIEMQANLENGSLSLAGAYKQILAGLQGMEAGTKRNAVGAKLLGTQFEDMGTAVALGVDLASTKMEDFEGAMDGVGAQYDTLRAKGMLLWRGFLSSLSTVVELLNEYINVVLSADAVTKFLVGTVAALVAGTIIWNTSLKFAVGALWNLVAALNAKIVAARAAQVAAGGLTASFTALSGIMQVVLATAGLLVVAFAAFAVGKAVQEFFAMREAMKAAEEAENNLIENSKRLRAEMEGFKDFQMPEDLTGKTQEELIELQQQVLKARLYWITMRNELEKTAAEKTILGKSTDEAVAAQKELENVNKKITDLSTQLKKAGETAKEINKVEQATKLSVKQMDEFEKAAKKAYAEATKQAETYAKKVIEFEEKIKNARLSTEDKLRELSRKTLSENEQWKDKEIQAEEKLTAAKAALKEQDFALAEKLAKQAEGLYADLAVEVKEDDVVVQTLEKTVEVAKAGVEETGKVMEEIYTVQKDGAQAMQTEYEKSASTIKASLDQLTEAKTAKIAPEIDDPALKKAQDTINELTKDEVKIIKVKTVEAKSSGGVAGFSSGGKLPGYSRMDRIPALLTAGERITNAFSTRLIDNILPGFMHALNLVKSPADLSKIMSKFAGGAQKFRNGGVIMPRISIPKFANGGTAQAAPGFATQSIENMGAIDVTAGEQTGQITGDKALLAGVLRELGKRQKLGTQGI